eukprot:701291-Amphidinium_carterae.1
MAAEKGTPLSTRACAMPTAPQCAGVAENPTSPYFALGLAPNIAISGKPAVKLKDIRLPYGSTKYHPTT